MITTTASTISYTANGTTTTFAIPFTFLEATDLTVQSLPPTPQVIPANAYYNVAGSYQVTLLAATTYQWIVGTNDTSIQVNTSSGVTTINASAAIKGIVTFTTAAGSAYLATMNGTANTLITSTITAQPRIYQNGQDYTVTGGLPNGGTVTFTTAPAQTLILTIFRTTAQIQDVDLIDNDSFPADTVESALDRLTLIVQELQNQINNQG